MMAIGYFIIGLLLCWPSFETDYKAGIVKEYRTTDYAQYLGVVIAWPILLVITWVKVTSGRYK